MVTGAGTGDQKKQITMSFLSLRVLQDTMRRGNAVRPTGRVT